MKKFCRTSPLPQETRKAKPFTKVVFHVNEAGETVYQREACEHPLSNVSAADFKLSSLLRNHADELLQPNHTIPTPDLHNAVELEGVADGLSSAKQKLDARKAAAAASAAASAPVPPTPPTE